MAEKEESVRRRLVLELRRRYGIPAAACMEKCEIESVGQGRMVVKCPTLTLEKMLEKLFRERVEHTLESILDRRVELSCQVADGVDPPKIEPEPTSWENGELPL